VVNAIYRPRLLLRTFASLGASDRTACIAHLVEALARIDTVWLLAHPETPDLYTSGVRYVPRGLGWCGDDWRDIPEVLRLKNGVCEDLTAWRIAELRLRHGINAEPVISSELTPMQGGDELVVYHVQLGLPDGSLEDPSVWLGM
jgi:hypothetical protein